MEFGFFNSGTALGAFGGEGEKVGLRVDGAFSFDTLAVAVPS